MVKFSTILFVATCVATCLYVCTASADARSVAVEVLPVDGPVGGANTWPFGETDSWTPYFMGAYTDIPNFTVAAGDVVAFCLDGSSPFTGTKNDADIQRTISFGYLNGNVGSNPIETLAPVNMVQVAFDQLGTGRGDATRGTFDLEFTLDSSFTYDSSLGDLVIALSTERNDDPSSNFIMIGGTSSDSSGKFLFRAFRQPSLTANFASFRSDLSHIPAFRIYNSGSDSNDDCVCELFEANSNVAMTSASSNGNCVCLQFNGDQSATNPAVKIGEEACEA
jgi:hypothetical protein